MLLRSITVALSLVGLVALAGCSGGARSTSPIPGAPPGGSRLTPHAIAGLAVARDGVIPGRIEIGYIADNIENAGQIDSELVGSSVDSNNRDIRVLTINVKPGDEAKTIARLARNRSVRFVAQDRFAHALAVPNDPSFAQQYSLKITQWDFAYSLNPSLGGLASTVIAIVDTGIQLDHPDLAGKLVAGTSFVTGASTATDDNGHGTHCAGIAAALTNNGIGIAGTNPLAMLMPVKVLDRAGSGSFSNVANGVTYAANNGAKIISMSLGCTAPCSDPATSSAIAYAKSKGVLVVVAAGNDGGAVGFPGSDPNSMAVAASDSTDSIAFFSNFGPQVSVAAPGVDILSTYIPSTYALLSGTSMSTPMVAGLAGLLVNATSTPATIRSQIEATADRVGTTPYVGGRNDNYGFGRINVARAVGAIGGPTPAPTAAPTATPAPGPIVTPAPTPIPCFDGDC